jgi:hypothetical protein
MPSQDYPDFTSGYTTVPNSGPLTSADYPDWTDGYFDVTGVIVPGEDFPDWVKAVGQITVTPTVPVGNYAGWWDATQISGVADGSALASWPDLSANTFNMTAAGTARPTYYSTTSAGLINGHPAVSFNGTTNVMTNGAVLQNTAPPVTLFAVFKQVSLVNGAVFFGEFAAFECFSLAYNSNQGHWEVSHHGTNLVNSQVPDTNPHVIVGVVNGSSSLVQIDGGTVDTGTLPGNSSTTNPFAIGDYSSSFMNGLIGEVIVYLSALSTVNQLRVTQYLKNKWGIP